MAIRLAADGVKPVVEERWTRYSAIPTLSVAAVQLSRTSVEFWTVAARLPGAPGACVSADGFLIWMIQPTDGTPLPLTANR